MKRCDIQKSTPWYVHITFQWYNVCLRHTKILHTYRAKHSEQNAKEHSDRCLPGTTWCSSSFLSSLFHFSNEFIRALHSLYAEKPHEREFHNGGPQFGWIKQLLPDRLHLVSRSPADEYDFGLKWTSTGREQKSHDSSYFRVSKRIHVTPRRQCGSFRILVRLNSFMGHKRPCAAMDIACRCSFCELGWYCWSLGSLCTWQKGDWSEIRKSGREKWRTKFFYGRLHR